MPQILTMTNIAMMPQKKWLFHSADSPWLSFNMFMEMLKKYAATAAIMSMRVPCPIMAKARFAISENVRGVPAAVATSGSESESTRATTAVLLLMSRVLG